MDFRNSFSPSRLQETAEELALAIPLIQDWSGCTRLDVAVAIRVPCTLLEQAMAVSHTLHDVIIMIEERSLSEDLVKMPHQITDKHVNASLLKDYYAQKYGRTNKVIEAKHGVEDKPTIPNITVINTGKDGSELMETDDE